MVNTKRVFIVKTWMSSPERVLYTQELDDTTVQTTYKFDKEIRKSISSIRSRYRRPIYESTCSFHGLFFCREDEISDISRWIGKADADMKKVNPSLAAHVHFIPLDVEAIKQGELYEQIRLAIKGQVFNDLLERVQELVYKQLPTRSKNSLLKMLTKMDKINVLDDPDITQKIEDIREHIEKETLIPLRDELEEEIKLMNQRGAFLEL